MPPDAIVTETPTVTALVRVFDRALRALGDAGAERQACELAADAWALLHEAYPTSGTRLNGTLHYLTRERPGAACRCAADAATAEAGTAAAAADDVLLDVRHLTPARRHETIFETFEALAPATAFVLVNDHDPKPLYYQFAAELPDRFTWQALEAGPEVWRVRIAKVAGA
jgi:uncharacterized protein (DUF2249 family)